MSVASCVCCFQQLGHGTGLPDSPPSEFESEDDFLKTVHHVLMEVGHLMQHT